MERAEIVTLLDEQRKYFNDSLDRLQRQLTDSTKDANKRINEVITSLEFTQHRLDESLTRLASVVKEKNEAVNKIQHLTEENQGLRTRLNETTDRLDYLDDQGRRNNLRFSGVPEHPGENWEQCQVKIKNVLRDKLSMQDVAFDRVHRVGKINNQKPRDIVAKFSSFPDRDAAFRNRRKLKGTNIYINEDLCPSTLEIRRRQLDALHEARRRGKQAFFNYRTLVIREPLGGGGGGGDGGRGRNPVRLPASPSPTRRTPPTSPPLGSARGASVSPLITPSGRRLTEGASGDQGLARDRDQVATYSSTVKDSRQALSGQQDKQQRPRKQPDRFTST